MKQLAIVFSVAVMVAMSAFAAEYRGDERLIINPQDTLFADLFAGSRITDILGYIEGDVYSGCQRINVEGEITEDLFAAAQEINLRGKVGDMLIGAGQSITIDGEVGGDVVAFGGEVRLTPRANIKGNLFIGSGSFMMDGGSVGGWIRGGAGDIYLNGSVADSIILEAGSIEFGNGFRAPAGTKLILSKELDESRLAELPENVAVVVKPKKPFYQSGFLYWSVIAMFVMGLLISLIFKNFIYGLLAAAGENVLKNIGVGFLSLILAPIAVVILAILILTIPAALILLGLFLILLYLSSIFTGLYMGKYIFELLGQTSERPNLILPLIVGLILVVLLSKIPFIGWLIKLTVICFGMGSFITYMWRLRRSPGLTK